MSLALLAGCLLPLIATNRRLTSLRLCPPQTRHTSCLLWWCTWAHTQTTVGLACVLRRAPAGLRCISLSGIFWRAQLACVCHSWPACSALSCQVLAVLCVQSMSHAGIRLLLSSLLLPHLAGHYVALVRTPCGQWVCFDDEQVNAITEAQVSEVVGGAERAL